MSLSWHKLITDTGMREDVPVQTTIQGIERFLTPLQTLADLQFQYPLIHTTQISSWKEILCWVESDKDIGPAEMSMTEPISLCLKHTYYSTSSIDHYGRRLFNAYLKWIAYIDMFDFYCDLEPYIEHIPNFIKYIITGINGVDMLIHQYVREITDVEIAIHIHNCIVGLDNIQDCLYVLQSWFCISEYTFYSGLREMVINTLKHVPTIPETWALESCMSLEKRILSTNIWHQYTVKPSVTECIRKRAKEWGILRNTPPNVEKYDMRWRHIIRDLDHHYPEWKVLPEIVFLQYILRI